ELGPEDLAALEATPRAPLPDAFAVLARIVAPSEEAIARGAYRVRLDTAVGPSGAMMLGRFCADEAIRREVERHLRAEEEHRPEAVFAEIAPPPHGRSGNLVVRPTLRRTEIPYLGRSGAAAEQQIPAGDLEVSIAGDRIVLWSRRLDREIVPRLTSA